MDVVELEWDEDKRQDALANRGLDFADIAFVDFSSIVTERDARYDDGEPRFSSYGYLNNILINFVWMPRQGRIRIISMRKANDRERKKYQAR